MLRLMVQSYPTAPLLNDGTDVHERMDSVLVLVVDEWPLSIRLTQEMSRRFTTTR